MTITLLGVALFALGLNRVREASERDAVVASDSPEILNAGIEFFERKVARDPSNTAVANALVRRYLIRFRTEADLEDMRRAEQVARGVLPVSRNPSDAEATLASILLGQHEFRPALDAAERAVLADPGNSIAQGALFDAALAAGEYARAEEALSYLPGNAIEGLARWAVWKDIRGEADAAASLLRRVCEQIGGSGTRPDAEAWCWTELAGVEAGRLGPEAAEHLYDHALDVRPRYRGALEGLADLAYAEGRWDDAARLYESIAVAAHPDLYLRLYEVNLMRGDIRAAEEFRGVFLRMAGEAGLERLFGPTLIDYYGEVDPERALAIAAREVERRPTVESFDKLAWIHYLCGDHAEALAASDRAWSWGEPSETMHFHRAGILDALGRSGEAEAHWDVVKSRPDLLDHHLLFRLHRERSTQQ